MFSGKRLTLLLAGLAVLCGVVLWLRPSGGGGSTGDGGVVSSVPVPDAGEGGAVLPDAVRSYLWETEHHVNILQKHGLSVWGDAWLSGDPGRFASIFSPELESFEADSAVVDSFESDGFTVRRERVSDPETWRPITRDAWLAWWGELRAEFPATPRFQPAVLFLSPEDPERLEGPWTGLVKLRIWRDADEADPVRRETVVKVRATFARVSEDAFDGSGWVTRARVVQVQRGRTEAPLFELATAERGLPTEGWFDNWKEPVTRQQSNSGGLYLLDFDRDGLLDLVVTDILAPGGIFLYRGMEGGRFEDWTARSGLARGPAGVVAVIDIDGDGWEDLIHLWANGPGGCRVYRNFEGRFVDGTGFGNLPELIGSVGGNNLPTALTVADYDSDGLTDLYVTRSAGASYKAGSWIDGGSGVIANNQLLRNLGGGTFEDVTALTGTDGGTRSTASAVWFDANGDRRPDVYVVDEFGDGVLLVNRGEHRFEGLDIAEGPSDWGTMGVTCGDFDNDGHVDLYVDNMYSKAGSRVFANLPPGSYDEGTMRKLWALVEGSELYRGLGDGRFEAVGQSFQVEAVGWSWGPAMADVNYDGWPDLYANAGFISQDRGKPDG